MTKSEHPRVLTFDNLAVRIHTSRASMGSDAAQAVAVRMKELLRSKPSISMAFAAAPSQNEFLSELISVSGIDWSRVVAFHLDEYVGLSNESPQSFAKFLKVALFDHVKPGRINYMNGDAQNSLNECKRYSELLKKHPLDIACIGIGENGHIAFNDPPVADFQDPALVKVVELDETCRLQQVHDGCFPRIDDVPTHALTMTIPAIMSADRIYCIVPGPTKQRAVKSALKGPISTDCPASVLRNHDAATLFVDEEAGKGLIS